MTANEGNGNNGSTENYGTKILDATIGQLTGGIELERGDNAVNFGLKALEAQAKALSKAKYPTTKPAEVSKTAANTAKMIDEVARLASFCRGGPDSRQAVDVAQSDAMQTILHSLTDEQFAVFAGWIREAREQGRLPKAEVS